MTSRRDRSLVARIGAGSATGVLDVDDPDAVAAAVCAQPGAVAVDVRDLAPCAAAARVRLAELVVDRARQAERRLAERRLADDPAWRPAEDAEPEDDPDADRQAVGFALVVLLLALPAGIAVYVVDGILLAPTLPAAALIGLGAVVLAHRRPVEPAPGGVATASGIGRADDDEHPLAGLDDSPAVRAAEAHLRRQLAAWKMSWWERDEAVPDLPGWAAAMPAGPPITLVAVDPDRRMDAGAHATMTAAAPAAVRVVVLQAR